jgi:hypothetical protein
LLSAVTGKHAVPVILSCPGESGPGLGLEHLGAPDCGLRTAGGHALGDRRGLATQSPESRLLSVMNAVSGLVTAVG